MYIKRGSIGVRTQNICFQEEKPIVGRIEIDIRKDEARKMRRYTPFSFIWVRVENSRVHFVSGFHEPGLLSSRPN